MSPTTTPIPTLILDGWLGRPRRWEPLRRMIESRVGPAEIFRYSSIGHVPLPELGQRLLKKIAEFSGPVNLVGFSMGGMVIRSAHMIEPNLRVNRAVFMNSPHRGTWMACLLPIAGVKQMRPFDAHVAALNERAWDVPTLTVWNKVDGVVLPGRNTHFGRGEHVQCRVPLHIWPVYSRSIQRRVVDFLASDVTGAGK